MLKFYGKIYRYEDTTIGVCELRSGLFKGYGSYAYLDPEFGVHTTRMPGSIFESPEKAQKMLDEFAAERGLSEVRACR